MKKIANARFAIQSWNEEPYSEGEGVPKLTRARVRKSLTGDISGEGEVEYLMAYLEDGSATFVGLERVTAQIAGKKGTFILQRTGEFKAGKANELYSIIPGSATGELKGLRGEGRTSVGHGSEHPFSLEYELA